jgi:O-antigen/teichoic acid export membrane protein
VLLAECAGFAVTALALPILIPIAGIIGAGCASIASYVVILLVQRRLMRLQPDETSREVPAGVPARLGP